MRRLLQKYTKRVIAAVLVLFLAAGTVLIPDSEAWAGNLIISLSSKSVKIGDTLTVTVTLPAGVTGTVNLTYSQDLFTFESASAENSVNAGTVAMTLGSYGNGNSRASGSVKLKAKAAGDAGIAASAPSAGNQDGDRVTLGGASVKVTVENEAGGSSDKSADAALSALTISKGTLSPAFSAETRAYSAEVENDVTSLAVSAQPRDGKAAVESVTGADSLSVGANTVTIVVKAENGVKETYTITVTRKAGEGQQEKPEETSETETVSDEKYFTIDGVNLYPSESIPDTLIPEGFVEDKVLLWDREYPCIRRDGDDMPLGLLYLVDENGANGAFYMTELENPTNIYPFVCVNYEQFMHTLEEETAETPVSKDTDALKADDTLKSQNRMILCGAGILVLILLIIIVVLVIKRKKEEDDDDYYYEDEEPEEEEETEDLSDESAGVSKHYEKESFGKSGFLHRILAGIDDLDEDLDDDLDDEDDLDDDLDDGVKSEGEKSREPDRKRAERAENRELEADLAREVMESLNDEKTQDNKKDDPMSGHRNNRDNRKNNRKNTKKDRKQDDSEDDIEFIDL